MSKQLINSANYTFDASEKTITFTGLGTVTINEVLVITNVTDNIIIYNFANPLLGGTITSNVLTLTYNTATMSDTDNLQVFLDLGEIAYDNSLDVIKTIDQSPLWNRYTDVETLVATTQVLTTSFADLGAEIDTRGYKTLSLFVVLDINSGVDTEIRVLHKHTAAGTQEFREVTPATPGSALTVISLNDYQVGTDADQLFKLNIDVTGTPYVQLQARTASGSGAEIDFAYITKMW